jgi:hypothetical protein
MNGRNCQVLSELEEKDFAFMEEERDHQLAIAYHLANGTPVFTDNPELENQFDKDATWEEEDFTEISAWLDELQDKLDIFRKAFNKQDVGKPKYRHLVKEVNEVRDYYKLLRNEVITRTCFCSREKLNWPEVNYDNPEWTRREEVATNRDLSNKEML